VFVSLCVLTVWEARAAASRTRAVVNERKDLGRSSQLSTYGGSAATRTWLNGNLHADNTGVFDDDQGQLVFALNDFDEAVIGDYQLDVWRLATSLVLVSRANGVFNAVDQGSIVEAFSEADLDTMDSYVGNDAEVPRQQHLWPAR